jgi:hypothetical protein
MAMSGLEGGDPAAIWKWPWHYFLAVRREYLKASGLTPRDEPADDSTTEIAPGITMTTRSNLEPDARAS